MASSLNIVWGGPNDLEPNFVSGIVKVFFRQRSIVDNAAATFVMFVVSLSHALWTREKEAVYICAPLSKINSLLFLLIPLWSLVYQS